MERNQSILFGTIFLVIAVVAAGIGFFISVRMDAMLLACTGAFIFVVLFVHGDYILFGLLFSMLLSPEIAVGETAKRDITLRFEDFLLLAMAFAWIIKMAIVKDPGIVVFSPINMKVNAYIAICAFSTMVGMINGRVDIASGLAFVLKYFEFYVVYIVVINNIKDRASLRYYIYVMLIVCGIICVVGLMMNYSGEGVAAPFEGKGGPERNTLGGYLVLMFALCMGLFLHEKQLRYKIFLSVLMPLILGTLVVSLSRSSWIAFVVIFLFFIFFLKPYRKQLLLALICLGILIPFLAPEKTKKRAEFTFRAQETQEDIVTVFNVQLDPSTSARLVSFQHALQEFYKHPFIGWGITGFGFIDSQYFRSLAEIGAVGLLAFLVMIYGIGRAALEVLKRVSDFEYGVVVGFLGGLAGLLVHSLAANTFSIVRIMEPFWFLTAIVMYLYIAEFRAHDAGLLEDATPKRLFSRS